MNTLQDRIRGSLIGGAIGDALGFIPKFFIAPNVIEAGEALGYEHIQATACEGMRLLLEKIKSQ